MDLISVSSTPSLALNITFQMIIGVIGIIHSLCIYDIFTSAKSQQCSMLSIAKGQVSLPHIV